MARETEIKLRVADAGAFRAALAKLGARNERGSNGPVHEYNVVFDTAGEHLKRRGQLLRIRTETREGKGKHSKQAQRVLLTFKRPVRSGARREGSAGRHKVREEIELQVPDGKSLAQIFVGLGMRPWFRYEKYRTTYRLPKEQHWAAGLLIELDETPIGLFAELEGPAHAIDHAAQALGFSKGDYIVENYFVLYREDCRRRGQEPRDMLFAAKNSGR